MRLYVFKVSGSCCISCHLVFESRFTGALQKRIYLCLFVLLSFVKSNCFSNYTVCSWHLHNEAPSSILKNKVVWRRVTMHISSLEIALFDVTE